MKSYFAVALGAVLALGISLDARAQVTAHEVKITVKTVVQTETGGGDTKPLKVTRNEDDIFEACVGHPPTKTQAIYLFIGCEANNDNLIGAIDTSTTPPTGLVILGHVHFDDPSVLTTSGGGAVLKALTGPSEVELECLGGDASAELTGIVDVTQKPVGQGSCVDTIKMKATGHGEAPVVGQYIIDDGSSFSVKKPNPAVVQPDFP